MGQLLLGFFSVWVRRSSTETVDGLRREGNDVTETQGTVCSAAKLCDKRNRSKLVSKGLTFLKVFFFFFWQSSMFVLQLLGQHFSPAV